MLSKQLPLSKPSLFGLERMVGLSMSLMCHCSVRNDSACRAWPPCPQHGAMKCRTLPSAQVLPPCRLRMERTLAEPMPISSTHHCVQALEHTEQLAGVLHVKAHAVVAHKKMVSTVSGRQRTSLSDSVRLWVNFKPFEIRLNRMMRNMAHSP